LKKFNPLVSIIIPVFNGANYLEGAIQSALGQAYQNIEILVINDGSTDDGATERIAQKFGDQIRYFHQANGGCAAALNCGIAHMRGEYFSWLSHDDLYLPEKIAEQIGLLDQLVNKSTIIFSAYEYIDEKDNHIAFVNPHEILPSKQLTNPLMPLLRGLINGCALLIPKKLFDEIGTFDVAKRTTQDYALWFDFLRKAPLEYIPKALIKSRIHSAQDTQKINDVHLRETNELWSGFLERLTLDEMKKLDGSHVGFLANMADHLTITPYNLALEKARQDIRQIVAKTSVTILVLVDDVTDLLAQSLQSIAQQTHTNLELLVVHPQSLTPQSLVIPTLGVHYYPYGDHFSKNAAISQAISESKGELIAFLKAGDIFKDEKIFEQVQWMLRQDAGISVTAFDSESAPPLSSSDQSSPEFHQNGFPKLLLKLDQYFSTLMINGSSARLLSSSNKDSSTAEALPLWCNIFNLHTVSYLDKPLTIEHKRTVQTLPQLQEVLLQKMLRVGLINSEEFLLGTNLSHRIQTESGFATTAFINHQLRAYQAYEDELMTFWGPKKPDYKIILIREQFAAVQLRLALILNTLRYRLRRKLLWIQCASLKDYEGVLVRVTKPLIPQFLWRYSTGLYRKTKQLITPNKQ
jgi:glycosyltransferase involved in cell wall biosynthesis